MSLAEEKAALDLIHDAEVEHEQAEMVGAYADILQEFSCIVEEAARRAARKMDDAGMLDRWYHRGEHKVRVGHEEAVSLVAAELAEQAREMFDAFRSDDLVRAQKEFA